MCGSLNWCLVWGCACMVSLLRARADLPGGCAALCAFADRPSNQRVNIFANHSEKNPLGVRAKPYTLPLLPNLFTCYWFASGEEEGSVCHAFPPCPLPSQVIYLAIYPLLANTSLRNQERLRGGRVGGGPGAFVSQDTQRESKGLRKLNAKVEHMHMPIWKEIASFFQSEWRSDFVKSEAEKKTASDFWRGKCGFGSPAQYPAAPTSQRCHAAFQRLTLSGVSQMVSERSGWSVHAIASEATFPSLFFTQKKIIRLH